jgi:putative hydrolase of the HAD superfamily
MMAHLAESKPSVIQAILFDGDDTLWKTELLYDAARARARVIVEDAGLAGDRWEDVERRVDVQNVARFGHTPERFPTSCVEAYDALCADGSLEPDPTVREAIRAAAQTVFTQSAPAVPGAARTLSKLRAQGIRLALLTKGDRLVQSMRIAESGLSPLFDAIEIVDEKHPADMVNILRTLGVSVDHALSVGNSVRSDILPSLAAGIRPIWIDAPVWEYERTETFVAPDGVIALTELPELLDLVEQ